MSPDKPTARAAAHRRRQSPRLPRRRHHLALSLGLLAVVAALPFLLARLVGDGADAEPHGAVAIATLPAGQRPSPLDASADRLPDLLADTVPVGDNPTEAMVRETKPGIATPDKPRVITLPEPDLEAPPLDASLTRQSASGPIPGPNAQGLTPLAAYRAAVPDLDDRRPVSLIVGGLGINAELTERAIRDLPAAVTLSFAPQAPDLQDWVGKARARGHEVLLEIPMAGTGFDPSATEADRTLRTDTDAERNRRTLHALLASAQGYAGVTHYQGEAFLTRTDAAAPVLAELAASGLAFFTDGSFETPSLSALAQSAKLPFRQGHGIIDPAPSRRIIDARLNRLSDAAATDTGVVGVGFAYPQTLDAVQGWAATLSDDGLVLVPATAALPE
ncbi:divergent polysaccharide deacetylase family protein [uncultured Algimonas sp.]|uniref:divergent polysaccharide deacetylase family protein n=1 Tax=uncultured Algimonas sp. TaxID=1547920 RepID=UPI002628FAFD|nr:divergent polysaccharide deacetylase family protein [uncultured Algimonas sp.]